MLKIDKLVKIIFYFPKRISLFFISVFGKYPLNLANFLCEYTLDSLIELWNWFETQIDMVAKSEEEYQAEL